VQCTAGLLLSYPSLYETMNEAAKQLFWGERRDICEPSQPRGHGPRFLIKYKPYAGERGEDRATILAGDCRVSQMALREL